MNDQNNYILQSLSGLYEIVTKLKDRIPEKPSTTDSTYVLVCKNGVLEWAETTECNNE